MSDEMLEAPDQIAAELGGWSLERTFTDLGIGKSLGHLEISRGRLPVVKIGNRTITTVQGRKSYHDLLAREAAERAIKRTPPKNAA